MNSSTQAGKCTQAQTSVRVQRVRCPHLDGDLPLWKAAGGSFVQHALEHLPIVPRAKLVPENNVTSSKLLRLRQRAKYTKGMCVCVCVWRRARKRPRERERETERERERERERVCYH